MKSLPSGPGKMLDPGDPEAAGLVALCEVLDKALTLDPQGAVLISAMAQVLARNMDDDMATKYCTLLAAATHAFRKMFLSPPDDETLQ